MPRARLGRIWPKEHEQLIPAPSALAGRSEHSQQRQSAPMMAMLAEERVGVGANERGGSEGSQPVLSGQVRFQWLRHEPNVSSRRQPGNKIDLLASCCAEFRKSETTLIQF